MKSGKRFIVSSIAGLALLGTIVGSVAAAPPTPTPPNAAVQQQAGRGYGTGLGYQSFGAPEATAKLLGMTADQIRAERQAGKSLGQIADEKVVKRDALVNAMVEARKAALDARVKAGTLTQEQADQALATMKQRMTQSLDRTEVGPNRPTDGPALGLAWGRGGRGAQQGPQDGTGFGRGFGAGLHR